jgi:hypothetical protein
VYFEQSDKFSTNSAFLQVGEAHFFTVIRAVEVFPVEWIVIKL